MGQLAMLQSSLNMIAQSIPASGAIFNLYTSRRRFQSTQFANKPSVVAEGLLCPGWIASN
jgi:hypothetical protein